MVVTALSLAVGYVPGATPAKWARTWAQRHPAVPLTLVGVAAADAADAVRTGAVGVALLRLPTDTSGLAVIGLYEETTVVVVPTDHLLAAAEELTAADLAFVNAQSKLVTEPGEFEVFVGNLKANFRYAE